MIKSYVKDGAGVILLNRPEKRNSLHPELISALRNELAVMKADGNVKGIILTGEGNSFCAGADLQYLQDLSEYSMLKNEEDSHNIAQLFLDVHNFPKPVIAAVNGPAIAGGCGLASVCDIVVADRERAKFGYTEVKIGFTPAIVSIFLMKRIGEGRARQLLLTGTIIDAERAYQLGLADYIAGDALEESIKICSEIFKNSSFSYSFSKEMLKTISNFTVEEAVDYCIRLNTISRSSADFAAGISRFLNKNKD